MASDVKTDYPAQYYAMYDTAAPQPTPVTGWFDTWNMGSIANVPPASEMIAVTADQWNDTAFRLPAGKGIQGGKVIDYTAPAIVISLAAQAENELSWISQQGSLASAMGETFTEAMRSYVKAIQAIASGTDTTSTDLPPRPNPIMA